VCAKHGRQAIQLSDVFSFHIGERRNRIQTINRGSGMITDYFIIEAENAVSLSNEVHKWLREGCKPQGGVSMAVDSHDQTNYLQAMIREEA
jgi:hypothetical protein